MRPTPTASPTLPRIAALRCRKARSKTMAPSSSTACGSIRRSVSCRVSAWVMTVTPSGSSSTSTCPAAGFSTCSTRPASVARAAPERSNAASTRSSPGGKKGSSSVAAAERSGASKMRGKRSAGNGAARSLKVTGSVMATQYITRAAAAQPPTKKRAIGALSWGACDAQLREEGTTTGARLILKTFVNDPDPEIASVFPLWKGADWMEREVYDMYGVVFTGHPDLRRILMPEEFTSYPMRKDYPLRGRGERHNFPVITRAEG